MIDINCDMGESYGRFKIGNDDAIIKYVDSCNIACGFHAGDPATIEHTISLAIKHRKNIGAHPGYPDLSGFGRRSMNMSYQDFRSTILYQIAVIKSLAEIKGGNLHHVKPHGALYHDLYFDGEKADIFCQIIQEVQSDLIVFTNPGSKLEQIASSRGITVWREAFADRRYHNDLSLVSRSEPHAVIHNPEEAASQVRMIAEDHKIKTQSGALKNLQAHTICIHGDSPFALKIAQAVRKIIS